MPADLVGSFQEWGAPARILVSGDQPLMRSAFGALLTANGLAVSDECLNQPDALRRAVERGIDLVVMDLDLDANRLTRMEKLERLLVAANGCPVLIITRSEDPTATVTALRTGAAAVVLKTRPTEVLMRAIRTVLAGDSWMERSTVASAFRPPSTRNDVIVAEKLTRREAQVVELVSLGLQNKKIAARLSITETTVRHHLTSIFDKLALTNRMELMRYAYREGAASEIPPEIPPEIMEQN
ncbi:MAG TPA: response regulator transcription factor [Thermoanaerobaculia bacterium]|jgi:DNA-binding NarL/FixJ family response regulator|nr:response regulator transcription factor [Thermoanaerobaculia bacterium]